MSITFRKLRLTHWRQFDEVDIDFHERATILTGSNGSGKSALLRILARDLHQSTKPEQIVEPEQFLEYSIPELDHRGNVAYRMSVPNPPPPKGKDQHRQPHGIGTLSHHGSDRTCSLTLAEPSAHVQPLNVGGAPNVAGIFLPSHRTPFSYSHVSSIQLSPQRIEQGDFFGASALQEVLRASRNGESVSKSLKSILPNWAIFSWAGGHAGQSTRAGDLLQSFEDVLRDVLPDSVGFRQLGLRPPEVMLVTDTGDFMIDAVSGGLGAVIELAWMIFLFDPSKQTTFTLVIDEPENHLHPKMQRLILPSLLKTFPNLHIVAATHSPLLVSSVEDASVFALRHTGPIRNGHRTVVSEYIDLSKSFATANEVLREVLGVEVTMPIWVETKLKDVVELFQGQPLNDYTFDQIRQSLEQLGLGEFMPSTFSQFIAANRER